jgi:hypothetical protein
MAPKLLLSEDALGLFTLYNFRVNSKVYTE